MNISPEMLKQAQARQRCIACFHPVRRLGRSNACFRVFLQEMMANMSPAQLAEVRARQSRPACGSVSPQTHAE